MNELAWAAGFFDGEGSVFVAKSKNGKYGYLSCSITQADKRPLERFLSAVGVGKIEGPYQPSNKRARPYYRIQVTGNKTARQFLSKIWDYLSEPKREQATLAMLGALKFA